jgi:hypothetical protein
MTTQHVGGIRSEDYWDFQPGEHVMTIDGFPGVVDQVEDGPIAGAENYLVTLDNGMGGGNYSASMLSKMPSSRAAAGVHLAVEDYPELGSILDERPDPGKMTFTAALSEERQEADAEDHDEPGGDDAPSSCSYCGSTDFKDLTDNGRVRQATCATCGGTMSAHEGMQWTPELIGDPSNHPSPAVDPRSGASLGTGAPGQAGINDFIDFDSRVSTTASVEDDTATIPTRRVGFAGYVEGEKTNFANHGDNPDWEDEQAVGQHTGVHEFRGYSGRENDFAHWHDKGEITHVPLHGSTIYATQARVTKRGVDSYLKDPDRRSGSGRPNYPANDRPIFVKHGGDYYALDGHHRTAAAMLRGDKSVEGHVYDADKHGFPEPEWSPFSKRLPRSLEKYSALAGAYLGCGFDSDDESEALQHELAYHDDGFCSAHSHQKTARNWAFQLHEQDTGGTKFPVKHTLHVHDEESRQSGGHVEYFPPKRRGGPVHIDSLHPSLDTPGSGSALLNEIQDRHPGSTMKFLHEQKRDQNTPSHTNSAHGEPTDWDLWHPGVKDEGIHRGFALRVEPHHAQVLNDPTKSKAEHLQALHEAMPEGHKMGMHWSTNEQRATSFAHSGVMDPRRDIPVVLHAKGPERKDIETRPEHLFRNGVFPYDHASKEREVPIRRGRKVEVTGMSWKPDIEHPDADRNGWVHHTYDEGEAKQHTASWGPVNITLLKIADVPSSLPERVVSEEPQPSAGELHGAMRRLAAQMRTASEENWVGHRPPGPGNGAPLHDLNDVHGTYGGSPFGAGHSDIYSHPQHWTGFHDHELDRAIKSAEGKPDNPITIYRAQPAEHHGIRTGDWVTPSASYAHLHGSEGFDGPVHIVKAVVPAHHVWTNADDIAEAGYHGPAIEHALHHADVED